MKKSLGVRRWIFLFSLLLVFVVVPLSAAEAAGVVEASFSYARQTGPGSNQFALWVEDSEGRCVRTLYATRFTATGGWEKRPESVKLWVEKSGLPGMTDAEVDAITGPTPGPGVLKYAWDLTDGAGRPVADGAYTLFIEGSLRSEKRVLYSIAFETGGGAKELACETRYFGDDGPERAMLSDVKARYTPQ
ncbi:MAG: DUF2271 domain-containing protein [Synergistaceae bacterium]|nr:DUF2271 domain-containing protein [Synergistaceae bacterium]